MSNYPLFKHKDQRNIYLDKLIVNGYQVKAKTVFIEGTKFFTVEDIDKRKGK